MSGRDASPQSLELFGFRDAKFCFGRPVGRQSPAIGVTGSAGLVRDAAAVDINLPADRRLSSVAAGPHRCALGAGCPDHTDLLVLFQGQIDGLQDRHIAKMLVKHADAQDLWLLFHRDAPLETRPASCGWPVGSD
ncbi:hypothetical protein EIO_3238 (plasmid) [Ketogulonicigenium vulgare Y25]|nr:hypothetical protein EIO_3238 [Ketogulonicigenium vulgare Y25]